MDKIKYLCGQCNSGYAHKSSLKKHINSAHNNRRYICSICQKEYIRKVYFIAHRSKFHQPLIVKQSKDNISYTPPPEHVHKQPGTNQHSITATTDALTGKTDWETKLRGDLALSDEDEPTNSRAPIGTLTDVTRKSTPHHSEILKLPD